MMPRFTFYIISEILKLFLVALVVMTLVIILGTLVQKMIAEGLGWLAIIRLLPYATVCALQFTIAATFLFAVCSVYGRMAADNEVVAVKSIGISPWRLLSPIMILGLLISPMAVWLNDLAFSWAKPGMTRVIVHSIEEIAYQALQSRKSYVAQGFSINVQDVEDKWLIKPTIIIYSQGAGQSQTIFADRAKLSLNPETETLAFELINSEGEQGKAGVNLPGPTRMEFALDRASRKGVEKNSPGTYPLREIGTEIRKQDNLISETRDLIAARCSVALATGRFQLFDEPQFNNLNHSTNEGIKRLRHLETEPWRRWSLGFSCFFFIWVGAPLAIWMRSADHWTTFGLCFLPILLVYYPLYTWALEQSKDGLWPGYSLWLANGVWLAAGWWLIRKACRN